MKCYGCTAEYDPMDVKASKLHCSHTGDTGRDRLTLLGMINTLQAQRDEAIRGSRQLGETLRRIRGERDQAFAEYEQLRDDKAGILEGYSSD
jgi:hypothetical protein